MGEPSAVVIFQQDMPCRGCGLNLRGLPADGACPDCGAKQAVAPATSKLSGTIDWELKCVRCAYVLQGLDRGVTCPECGLSIAETLRPTTLRTHSKESLRKARVALLVLMCGVVGLLGSVLISMAGLASAFGPRTGQTYGIGALARGLLWELALLVCAISAIVFVRELMPKALNRGKRPGSATVTVVGAWMMLVCSLVLLGLNAILLATGWTTFNPAGGTNVSGAFFALASLSTLAWFPTVIGLGLSYFGGLSLLKWVGQQCESVKVYKRATRLNILSIVIAAGVPGMYFILFIAMAAMMGGLGGGGTAAFIAAPILLVLALLTAVVMFVGLLGMVRRELMRLIEGEPDPATSVAVPGTDVGAAS